MLRGFVGSGYEAIGVKEKRSVEGLEIGLEVRSRVSVLTREGNELMLDGLNEQIISVLGSDWE